MKVEKFGDVNKAAFNNDQAIKNLKVDLNVRWLKMAELLFENQKRKFYSVLGYDTFESYIAQEELGFQRNSVYKIIGIYKDLVLDRNVSQRDIADIDHDKLAMIRPMLPDGDLNELLSKARSLSRSDLKAELTASHECTPMQITICSICKKRLPEPN